MACLILHAPALARLAAGAPQVVVPKLEATDDRDDYSAAEGDGVWIPRYVAFMEQIVRSRCGLPRFAFTDDYRLNESLFKEIPCPHLQGLLLEFTNRYYPAWKDADVDFPDYGDVREGCRSFCEDCDYAYEETHGTYAGPLAEDVDPDEDVNLPDLSEGERLARLYRNARKQAERRRRERAQEAAESEVIDREWVCSEDCDSFIDYVDDEFRDRVDVDMEPIESKWAAFLVEKGVRAFPPLIVELARIRT